MPHYLKLSATCVNFTSNKWQARIRSEKNVSVELVQSFMLKIT